MHNALFAVATDFSRHNSHKMRHSALTLEVSFQERDDSYPKLSKSTFYLNDLPTCEKPESILGRLVSAEERSDEGGDTEEETGKHDFN